MYSNNFKNSISKIEFLHFSVKIHVKFVCKVKIKKVILTFFSYKKGEGDNSTFQKEEVMEENYLENIRGYIVSEQARTIVRDYNANKSKLETCYNIGKELSEAGKHYGEGIVKTYAVKLTNEFGKSYGFTNLNYMRQFYNFILTFPNFQPVVGKLTWTHILMLLPLKDPEEIKFYIDLTIRDNLSKRALAERIKSDEYGRLTPETKLKLKEEKEVSQPEMVPSTIQIPYNKTKEQLTEKVLEEAIITNISYIMKQLGEGYSFIDKQYR